MLEDEDVIPVFQLSEQKKLYTAWVEQLGEDPSEIHSTKLKNKILSYFPELEAHSEDRRVLLVTPANVGKSLRRAGQLDDDGKAVVLSLAVNIIRRYMSD